MSTFGVPVDFQDMVPIRGSPSRTTNVSGTTNMADGLQTQAQGDSGKNRVTGFTDQAPVPRHQPIPVETPRAPPTHDITQEAAIKKGKEEMTVSEPHLGPCWCSRRGLLQGLVGVTLGPQGSVSKLTI